MFFSRKEKVAEENIPEKEEYTPAPKKAMSTFIRVAVTKLDSTFSTNKIVESATQELLDRLKAGEEITLEGIQEADIFNVIDTRTLDLEKFRRILLKYGMNFAVLKDSETGKYEVLYKCNDTTCLQEALEKMLVAFQNARPSLEETLAWAKKKVEEQDQQPRGYNRYK